MWLMPTKKKLIMAKPIKKWVNLSNHLVYPAVISGYCCRRRTKGEMFSQSLKVLDQTFWNSQINEHFFLFCHFTWKEFPGFNSFKRSSKCDPAESPGFAGDLVFPHNDNYDDFQLRYLQTLNSISAEHNSTIIFPMPIGCQLQRRIIKMETNWQML